MRSSKGGFTVVELIIIVVVIAILAAITMVGYGNWQRSVATSSVQNDITHGAIGLKNYANFNTGYPPNLAGIDFQGSENVSLALWTNAQGVPVYSNLTPDENTQLLLFACNAYMPITDGGTTYNTACSIAGQNLHVSGQKSSNIVLKGPTVTLSDFSLTCGPACTTARQQILDIFQQQGGTWPLTVSNNTVVLPKPSNFTATTNATAYCLQGTSPTFADIVYHITNTDTNIQAGPCPDNPALHYP